MGGAADRRAGQVDRGPKRVVPRGLQRPRSARGRRDGVRCVRTDPRLTGDDPSQPRVPGRTVGRASAAHRRADVVRRVRHSGDARHRPRRAHALAHAHHLPRCRPPRGDLPRGTDARSGRVRARRRSGRVASAQSHRDDAVSHGDRRDLRLRRIRGDPRCRPRAGRLGRLCRPAGGDRGARPEARPRPRDVHRGVRNRLRPDGDPVRSDRRCDRRRGHVLLRPGSRDDVRADARRLARPPARADPSDPGRHRPGVVRPRQLRLAHRDGRRLGAARRPRTGSSRRGSASPRTSSRRTKPTSHSSAVASSSRAPTGR